MDKKKITMIAGITLILVALIGGTVAFFGWRADKESNIEVTVTSGDGVCAVSFDNNVLIEPTSDKTKGRIIKLKAKQELGSKATIAWNMIINKIDGLQDKTFMYELVNTTTGVTYGSGNFENISNESSISFSNGSETLNFNEDYEFTLYLWIDGTKGNNALSMADQNFDFKLNCELQSVDE